MSNYVRLAVVLSLALGPAAAASCASTAPSSGDSGHSIEGLGAAGSGGSGGEQGDSLAVTPVVDTFGFPDTPVGRALDAHMALEMRSDGESVFLYSASFAFLRANAPEVVAELMAAYERLPEERYLARWHLVRTLSGLELREAAGGLDSIVHRPVPPERWAPNHEGHSSVGEEAILRMRAIDGLKALALSGSAEASDSLRRAVNSPLASVRRAAVQSYVAAGRRAPSRLAEARTMLPTEQRHWVDLRPATSADFAVPTPDPPAPGEKQPPVAPARPH
jgi:hypothetical protein